MLRHEAGRHFILYFDLKIGKILSHSDRQGVVPQIIRWNSYEAGRWFIIYFQNSMWGMRGFHFMAPESQMRDTDLICSFCRPYIYIYYCLSPLHYYHYQITQTSGFKWLSIPKIWYSRSPLYFLDSGLNSRSQWICKYLLLNTWPERGSYKVSCCTRQPRRQYWLIWSSSHIKHTEDFCGHGTCDVIRNICVCGSLRQWCKCFLIEFYMDLCSNCN